MFLDGVGSFHLNDLARWCEVAGLYSSEKTSQSKSSALESEILLEMWLCYCSALYSLLWITVMWSYSRIERERMQLLRTIWYEGGFLIGLWAIRSCIQEFTTPTSSWQIRHEVLRRERKINVQQLIRQSGVSGNCHLVNIIPPTNDEGIKSMVSSPSSSNHQQDCVIII